MSPSGTLTWQIGAVTVGGDRTSLRNELTGRNNVPEYRVMAARGNVVIDLSLFSKPVQIIAGFIPVTHAIAQLQNVMLFGSAPDPQAIVALFAIAAVSIMFGWLLLRRQMGARS